MKGQPESHAIYLHMVSILQSYPEPFVNLAADTIFIAEVICLVDFTDEILILIAFKFAIEKSFIQVILITVVDIFQLIPKQLFQELL